VGAWLFKNWEDIKKTKKCFRGHGGGENGAKNALGGCRRHKAVQNPRAEHRYRPVELRESGFGAEVWVEVVRKCHRARYM
jgi:hypothetical protein